MKVTKLIKSVTVLIFAFGILLFPAPREASAESSKITFALGTPGVAFEQPNILLVAVQLSNTSDKTAYKVKINSIRFESAHLLTATPLRIDMITASQSVVVQANFNSKQLNPGKEYQLVMRGSYRATQADGDKDDKDDDEFEGQRHKFVVRGTVILPPTSPGSAPLSTVTLPAQQVTDAPFPPQPPDFEEDEANPAGPPVPTGSFVPTAPTDTSTVVQPSSLAQAALAPAANPIVFLANNGLGLSASTIAEPSGATGGSIIFATTNWSAAYSTDGGVTFAGLNPTTIFPNDAVGFCCDQIVQYAPSIDRFIWLLQGNNGYRLAMASPANIINNSGTAWTYWNLTTNVFGSCTSFDYPDLSMGNNFLYISWDAGGGCNGFQVARISLTGIQAAGTITIEFTDPANGSMAWGSHLSQDTGDEIFWAGHNSNSQMRIFSLQEGSNIYFWRDVNIGSWANNSPTSTTPDGQDWLCKNFNACTGNGAFPRNGVIGATHAGNQLWFAWSAGTDSNFQQAHIEMVTLDRNNNFNLTQQVQIWNNSYAFAYPALATNGCTGEVGLSFEYGGNGNFQNHVVGFWGDFIAYITTGSNVGTTRFGDYVTIRQEPATNANPGNLFNAFGYGLNSVPPPGTGTNTDIHYVLFGRPASSCANPG